MPEIRTVFIDLETGGLEPEHPDIQIAAVAVDGSFKEIAHWECKIRFPVGDADPEALKLNHYDAAVWDAEGITEVQAVNDFYDFLQGFKDLHRMSKRSGKPYSVARLAGQNVLGFDGPRLRNLFARHEKFLPADAYRPLDTMQLALWRSAKTGVVFDDYKLATLCDWYKVPLPMAHDAMEDVRATAQLARVMLFGAGEG